MKKNSTFVLRQENTLSPDALIEALSGSVITQPDGVVVYLNAAGKPHRTDGPAVITATGSRYWYRNGKLHRTDGPAIMFSGGSCDWYLNGVSMPEDVFWQRIASGDHLEP